MNPTRVQGKSIKNILIFTLSTCMWCKKLKNFLNEKGLEYCYIDMDLLMEPERGEVLAELKRWNSSVSFPTIVIDQKNCIVGFDESKIKKVLEL